MRTDVRDECGPGEIVSWRRERLAEAGFPVPLAARLARDPPYNLHALTELCERGCPPELAVRIMAPLELGDAA
jgi:hypothetical protein